MPTICGGFSFSSRLQRYEIIVINHHLNITFFHNYNLKFPTLTNNVKVLFITNLRTKGRRKGN